MSSTEQLRQQRSIKWTYLGVAAIAIVACVGACRDRRQVDTGPNLNVILISADTLRADRLNCYGYEKRKTSPNVDAFARESVLFENAITASPWTTPAHLSLFTSLNPSTHGITAPFGQFWKDLREGSKYFRLAESKTTLAEVLKSHSYLTAAFTAGGTLDPQIGFNQGFDLYGTNMFKLNKENMNEMYAWLDSNHNRPFFLFWHHFEAHAPYLYTDFLREVMKEKAAEALSKDLATIKPLPNNDVWPMGAALLRRTQREILMKHRAFNPRVCEALYTGNVRSLDRWFGDFIGKLRRLNLYDRSLIIFLSDHGEEFADHTPQSFYNRHGHSLYEEMVRIPLIVKLPNNKHAGMRISGVVRLIDVMPTILDLLSLIPKESEMQGLSLRPLWERRGTAPERVAFIEATTGATEKKGTRTKQHKYIFNIDRATVRSRGKTFMPAQSESEELYDLGTDPGEKQNLITAQTRETLEPIIEQQMDTIHHELPKGKVITDSTKLDDLTIKRLKVLGYIGEKGKSDTRAGKKTRPDGGQ